jgi:hypothetical protein
VKLPSLYPDVNIFSSMTYHGRNQLLLSRKLETCEWWRAERKHFALVTSFLTEVELAQGIYLGQMEAIQIARRLPRLTKTGQVTRCAQAFLDSGSIPPNQEADAFHLAFASVHRIDYLLTWNHAHLANPNITKRFDEICIEQGGTLPLIVEPSSIPWSSMGKDVRRR